MAIKAGLVGVNPKGVDKNGMPIGSGGADVEAEIQQINLDIAQLQTSKVGIGQLEANNKAFHFAYDATSQKYGYKLDGAGDFIPFEEGGIGWVPPKNLTSEGITMASGFTLEQGGYYTDGTYAYIDIFINMASAGSGTSIKPFTLPSSIAPSSVQKNLTYLNTPLDNPARYYNQNQYNAFIAKTSGECTINTASAPSTGYYHVWGMYKIAGY